MRTIVISCAIALAACGKGHARIQRVDRLAAAAGDSVQVFGYVAAGSIDRTIVDQRARVTFVVEAKGKRLRVTAEGPQSDALVDQAAVVVAGTMHGADAIDAPPDGVAAYRCVPAKVLADLDDDVRAELERGQTADCR